MTLLPFPLLAPPQSSSLFPRLSWLCLCAIIPLSLSRHCTSLTSCFFHLFYSSTFIRPFLCQPHFYSLVQFPGQNNTSLILQHTLLNTSLFQTKQRSERTEKNFVTLPFFTSSIHSPPHSNPISPSPHSLTP
ncbi:hypothetical protein BKA57DRAFT_279735 [Linnemannia elongata]|nr:hypothetical protein BKA57DRAFT_279735 [Linnemannia elongata]